MSGARHYGSKLWRRGQIKRKVARLVKKSGIWSISRSNYVCADVIVHASPAKITMDAAERADITRRAHRPFDRLPRNAITLIVHLRHVRDQLLDLDQLLPRLLGLDFTLSEKPGEIGETLVDAGFVSVDDAAAPDDATDE